jgi:tRNA threonylcarbamoyladenosine biosynthesis protein TsaE
MPECTLILTHPDDTSRRAVALGRTLTAGDVILLCGDVGAGKTHFARSLIKSLLTTPQDIPSPTFTLVQTYDTTSGEVWHADLYRLTSPDEVEELGLIDAFENAISLVEWPDRLASLKPDNALTLELTPQTDDDARKLTASWSDAKWDDKILVWHT